MSKRKTGGKSARDPSVKHSRREKDARAGVAKGQRSARGVGPPCEKCGQIHKRCSAHNRFGKACGQMPLRYQQVCRSHGGNTKQSKRAAQERMMDLVWPALARLDQLVNDPDTDPAIVVKVVSQILDRAHAAGLTRHSQVGVSLEPTPFDDLQSSAFVIMRGRDAITDDTDEPEAIKGPDDEALGDFLAARQRDKAREASTKLDNKGHDVVPGAVVSPDESNLFGFERTREQKYKQSGRSEHDPDGTRPGEEPWSRFEARVREGTEDPRPRRP